MKSSKKFKGLSGLHFASNHYGAYFEDLSIYH